MGESFLSIFTGSSQSRYAGFAIMLSVIVVSLVILFGKDNIPLSQKFSFVLLIFLISLPAILMTLFQLTCLVRGTGANNERWWCGVYAWIISIILILYCTLLVFVAITALITGEKVLQDIGDSDMQEFKRNNDTATAIVQEYFSTQEAQANASDYSQGVNMDPTQEGQEWINQQNSVNQDNIPLNNMQYGGGNIQMTDTPVDVPIPPALRNEVMQQMNVSTQSSALTPEIQQILNQIGSQPQVPSPQMAAVLAQNKVSMASAMQQNMAVPQSVSPQMQHVMALNAAVLGSSMEKFKNRPPFPGGNLPAPAVQDKNTFNSLTNLQAYQ